MTEPGPRWTPVSADRIQLYTLPTPNGKKISIALEELGLPYEAHPINIMKGDQFLPEFVAINPNSKIPAIVDPAGPDGQPLAIMESGAILIYLAQKTGRLMGGTPRQHNQVMQWVFFQVANVGPMFGQFGHFYKYAADKTDTTYGVERYGTEVRRQLALLDARLADRPWIVDDYSIADIAICPWIACLEFYGAREHLDVAGFTHVDDWLTRFRARPAVQRGWEIGLPG